MDRGEFEPGDVVVLKCGSRPLVVAKAFYRDNVSVADVVTTTTDGALQAMCIPTATLINETWKKGPKVA